jgi:hypothetical protein
MLPTVCVAVVAWRINRPGHIRDVEIELGRQLGLQVTLDSVHYPKPGDVAYQGIVIRQEEPRGRGLSEVARADVVRMVRGDRELALHAENLRMRGESPKQAIAHVVSMLQRSDKISYERINLAAPQCRIDLGQEGLEFSAVDVAGEFIPNRSIPTLRVAYRLSHTGTGTHCELILNRDRTEANVRTVLVLKTLEGPPLPARVLNVFFDATDWLGDKAKLDGRLTLSQNGEKEWEASFQGNLLDFDLSALIGKNFPRHRLAGLGRVSLEKARWGDRPGQGPGWLDAKGTLYATQGAIGVGLCSALAQEMKFRLAPRMARLDERTSELEFRALGVSFDMRSSGEIHLSGALGGEFTAETVLVSASAPLIFAPTGTATVHGLIKTLFPVSDSPPGVMVPLTSESRVLLCLPVAPEIATQRKRTLGGN